MPGQERGVDRSARRWFTATRQIVGTASRCCLIARLLSDQERRDKSDPTATFAARDLPSKVGPFRTLTTSALRHSGVCAMASGREWPISARHHQREGVWFPAEHDAKAQPKFRADLDPAKKRKDHRLDRPPRHRLAALSTTPFERNDPALHLLRNALRSLRGLSF